MVVLARLAGTAKPMFCASAMTAVLMPITSPHRFRSGPPELPGLMDASVWMSGSRTEYGVSGSTRFIPDTMPRVSV